MVKKAKILALASAVMLMLTTVSQAQTAYEILFTCDMAVQITCGNFDPNNGTDQVFVRGL